MRTEDILNELKSIESGEWSEDSLNAISEVIKDYENRLSGARGAVDEAKSRYELATTPPMPADGAAYYNSGQVHLQDAFIEGAIWSDNSPFCFNAVIDYKSGDLLQLDNKELKKVVEQLGTSYVKVKFSKR